MDSGLYKAYRHARRSTAVRDLDASVRGHPGPVTTSAHPSAPGPRTGGGMTHRGMQLAVCDSATAAVQTFPGPVGGEPDERVRPYYVGVKGCRVQLSGLHRRRCGLADGVARGEDQFLQLSTRVSSRPARPLPSRTYRRFRLVVALRSPRGSAVWMRMPRWTRAYRAADLRSHPPYCY